MKRIALLVSLVVVAVVGLTALLPALISRGHELILEIDAWEARPFDAQGRHKLFLHCRAHFDDQRYQLIEDDGCITFYDRSKQIAIQRDIIRYKRKGNKLYTFNEDTKCRIDQFVFAVFDFDRGVFVWSDSLESFELEDRQILSVLQVQDFRFWE